MPVMAITHITFGVSGAYEAREYIYHGRLHHLVATGALEAYGDIAKPGYSEVRHAPNVEAGASKGRA
jgi:hypothetical protein